MPLEIILPAEKLLKLSPGEFKDRAAECRKGKKKVCRMLHDKRRDIEELESKKHIKPKERQRHQELCARVIELGQEEGGYDLQIKELDKAIRTWFI